MTASSLSSSLLLCFLIQEATCFSAVRPAIVHRTTPAVVAATHSRRMYAVARVVPRSAVPMMAVAAGPMVLVLDLLGAALKLAWRFIVAAVVAVAIRPTVDDILRSQGRGDTASLLAPLLARVDKEAQLLKKIFRPKLVAAEKAKVAEKASVAAAAKAKAEQEAMAQSAAEAAEAEAVAERAAEETAKVRKAKEALEAKATEEMLLKRETEERERAAKVAEQQRLAREAIEKEKALKAKADAERAAKAKAIAEKKAAEKAAAEAAAKLGAVAAASAAAESSVISLLGEIADGVEDDRILTLEDTDEARSSALLASLKELEANSGALSAEVAREGMLGFWKGRLTSSSERATNGLTGYGADEYKGVLAHFQCFSKVEEGSLLPTAQTVEVILDMTSKNVASSTLKGEFKVSTAGSKLDVFEDYTVLEFGGMKQFGASPMPQRSTCSYLSPTLRVSRVDDGTLWVYEKVTAAEVTDEIFRLMSIAGPEDEDRDNTEAGYDS